MRLPFFHKHEKQPDSDLHLIVGLGNPGAKFAETRHNAGFMVIGRLAEKNGIQLRGAKQRAEVGRGAIAGQSALLALPLTYMNDSGHAVRRLLDYYHLPVENLLVVADDIDLPFGTLRLRPSGSSGGQKGLRSIEQSIGTSDFARLRVGVGRPADDVVDHVLTRFSKEQATVLPRLVDKAGEAVSAVLADGMDSAMNRYNRSWLSEL